MGYAENMQILSNINCTLASMNSYLDQRSNGVSAPQAQFNFWGNMTNGIARNQVAYDMQKWGNPVGNNINMYAGYGNPVSNQIGTTALLAANYQPWMFFNCYSYMPPCPPMPMNGFYASMGMGFNLGQGISGFFC